MSRFDDRLEQDLSHIADRATPSPTAWEAIQSRIAEHADEPEMEIIMLDKNRLETTRSKKGWMLSAAAALIVIVGGAIALTQLRDTDSLDVTGPTTTEVPTTTATEVPSTAANPADDAALTVAESYITARNTYDGSAVLALLADDAFIRDDLQRGGDGNFLGLDELDFAFNADFDRVTGVQLTDTECATGSPDRVRCTYTWENAWSQALGDDRYTGNSFVFDIAEGQIEGLTNTFAQGPVDGFENHISETTLVWVQTNHPDDRSTMYAGNGLVQTSAESLGLWERYTEEFVGTTVGQGRVTIETTINVDLVEGERVVGTGSGSFEVTDGAGFLGCTAGTVQESYSFQVSVDKILTCVSGERTGTFTISGGGQVNLWDIEDATGDFVGLSGSGAYHGRGIYLDETEPNPIYVFEVRESYTDTITGQMTFEDEPTG
ncbi:MAG: hypothetical protein ACR2NL_10220 [Acidimicrobiia bacterium]